MDLSHKKLGDIVCVPVRARVSKEQKRAGKKGRIVRGQRAKVAMRKLGGRTFKGVTFIGGKCTP